MKLTSIIASIVLAFTATAAVAGDEYQHIGTETIMGFTLEMYINPTATEKQGDYLYIDMMMLIGEIQIETDMIYDCTTGRVADAAVTGVYDVETRKAVNTGSAFTTEFIKSAKEAGTQDDRDANMLVCRMF